MPEGRPKEERSVYTDKNDRNLAPSLENEQKLKQAVSQFEEYSTQHQIAISQIASYSAANTNLPQLVQTESTQMSDALIVPPMAAQPNK